MVLDLSRFDMLVRLLVASNVWEWRLVLISEHRS